MTTDIMEDKTHTCDSDKEKFMARAIELGRINMQKNIGGPFGAVIVKDGKIVGEGWNKVTSSNDPTAHAEVSAIRDACKNLDSFMLNGCEIYSSCEPCPMCLSAIYWARLDYLYYGASQHDAAAVGFDDAFLYVEVALDKKDRSLKSDCICNDSAAEMMQEWLKKDDKIDY